MNRIDGRSPSQLRPITFQTGFTRWAETAPFARSQLDALVNPAGQGIIQLCESGEW